jgi:hypothetical protein
MILYTLVKSLVSRPICESSHVRGVSKIRVLNLTSGRTRQFIKQHFAKFAKVFLPTYFYQTSRFVWLTIVTELEWSIQTDSHNFPTPPKVKCNQQYAIQWQLDILRTLIDCTFFDRRQTQRVVWRELICRDATVFYIMWNNNWDGEFSIFHCFMFWN